ncbi:hypothetical protein BDZ89DRAFT_1067442 [Hymenopellis radicata]|nr:hypothetical protein BDZ89DRAFT_1067442 [Hymenopellis radicata]
MHTFLRLPASSAARQSFQTAVLTALIAEAKLVPGHPDLAHSMRALLSSQPSDVARALVRALSADSSALGAEKTLSLSALRLSLSTIFYCRSCIPAVRRALALEGVLDVLCLAARHAAKGLYHRSQRVGSCMCLLIQELSVFSRMAPRYVVRALESRLVDTLLRVDSVVGSDEALFDEREDRYHLSRMIAGCLGHLEGFLIYRSVLRACRRAVRRAMVVEGAEGDSEVKRQYEQLKAAVETQVKENEARDRVSKCVCVNPECPSTEASTSAKPRRCSGCLFTVYCSRPCQKTHWGNGHRAQCHVLDRARMSPPHALHLPPSPLDMALIYAMVEDDLREHTKVVDNLQTITTGPLVIELDYASEWGDVSSRPRISVRPLDAFRAAMEESSVIEYTDEMWDRLLETQRDRDGDGGGTYIAILISSMWLVDLTTEERIRSRLYPVHG